MPKYIVPVNSKFEMDGQAAILYRENGELEAAYNIEHSAEMLIRGQKLDAAQAVLMGMTLLMLLEQKKK